MIRDVLWTYENLANTNAALDEAPSTVADRIRAHRCERDSIGLDDPVDFVLAFWSIHETPDMHCLLGEVHRRLVGSGRILVVEPRGHVSATEFGNMVATAKEIGLSLHDEPRIRLSRAAVFVKK